MANRHEKFLWKHGDISAVSRKTKKAILGRKMNKHKLSKRLAVVVITRDSRGRVDDISDVFCPKCGCERERGTGNMVAYPEVWIRDYCLRCGFLVGTADNSPYYHALEFEEQGYEID